MTGAWNAHADHVRLCVRLTPNGGNDAIDGIEIGAGGEAYLKVSVSDVPEKGKANKALIALLSRKLDAPKSAISFISGDTSRKKILRIDGDPEEIVRTLAMIAKA